MNETSLIHVTRRSRQLDAVYRELSELLVGLDETRQDHWLALIEEAPAVPGPTIRCGSIVGVLLEPSPELLDILDSLRRVARSRAA